MQNTIASGVFASSKALPDPQKSTDVEKLLALVGAWTEPILIAYSIHLRHPDEPASLEKLLKTSCEATQQITQATGTAIALRNGSRFIYRSQCGELPSLVGTPVNSSGSGVGCTLLRQLLVSNDIPPDPRLNHALSERYFKSLLCIPIVQNGYTQGLLEVCSREKNAFNLNHIVPLQFIASLLANASARVRMPNSNQGPAGNVEAAVEKSIDPVQPPAPQNGERAVPSAVGVPLASLDASSDFTLAEQNVLATPRTGAPDAELGLAPSTFSACESSLRNETSAELPSADSTSAPERRSRTRIPLTCLAYVCLGENNGGMLLDINEAGFSIQAAFSLDPASPRKQTVRLTGNGDLEADCELVWEKEGQAGFKFVSCSADFPARLQAWTATNGMAPVATGHAVPRPRHAELAAVALAQLDEVRSMLLNSKLVTIPLKK